MVLIFLAPDDINLYDTYF